MSEQDEQHQGRHLICPVCSTEMQTVSRQGVEIERCPSCRGVWLDRGELDKLVAYSTNGHGAAHEQPVDDDDEADAATKLATRRSFFAELFDVD